MNLLDHSTINSTRLQKKNVKNIAKIHISIPIYGREEKIYETQMPGSRVSQSNQELAPRSLATKQNGQQAHHKSIVDPQSPLLL